MLYGYWMMKYYWLYDDYVIGSSLPSVLYVVLLSCDDHQFNWWEQMGEVPEVSKEVEILLHSPCGLVISAWVHLGLRPMYLSSLVLCILVNFSSSFFWASWYAMGCLELIPDRVFMLSLLWHSFNFTYLIKWGVII